MGRDKKGRRGHNCIVVAWSVVGSDIVVDSGGSSIPFFIQTESQSSDVHQPIFLCVRIPMPVAVGDGDEVEDKHVDEVKVDALGSTSGSVLDVERVFQCRPESSWERRNMVVERRRRYW
jgi:hypothetical protein